ncbi:MAG: hypothetical protein O7G87_23735 [bacterium]|nr:hypothetical protein [bacterium]
MKLESGVTWADRYPGSDKPLSAFAEAMREAKVYEGDPIHLQEKT